MTIAGHNQTVKFRVLQELLDPEWGFYRQDKCARGRRSVVACVATFAVLFTVGCDSETPALKPSNSPKVVEAATLAMEDPVAALAYSRDGNKLYAVSNAALLTMSASTDNRVISRVALRIDDPRTAKKR